VPLRPPALTRFPVPAANFTVLPPILQRPKPLAAVTVEGTVVDKSGQPLTGVLVIARLNGASATTAAGGHFALSSVDDNSPLFLRATKSGYAVTNTSYLNARGPKENLRILMLPDREAVGGAQATIVIGGASAGMTFASSPAETTEFKPVEQGSTVALGIMNIKFQPAYPAVSNDFEPNLIVSPEGSNKAIVLPVFAGQVSYGQLSAAR